MTAFALAIDVDNAAFEDNPDELADVLIKAAAAVIDFVFEPGHPHRSILLDSNGTTVGGWAKADTVEEAQALIADLDGVTMRKGTS
jgi:hypothetical protein